MTSGNGDSDTGIGDAAPGDNATPGDDATSADSDVSVTVETVLVPVDGTDSSTEAVEHGAAIADRYGASVHALYVLSPDQRSAAAGSGPGGAAADTVDREQVAADAQAYLDEVERICVDLGVDSSCSTAVGFSTRSLSRHPGSVVLDCADELGADFVVIPREPETEIPGLLEKAAEYVLAYASQPVLSV